MEAMGGKERETIGGDIEADVSASILIRNGASAASYREFIGIDWLFNIFARLLM